MAAQHLGRAACPECGFESAHVRQNEGKHPYRWCPDCGANYAARNARQAADLLGKVRADGAAAAPAKPASPAPAPAPVRKPGLFESLGLA